MYEREKRIVKEGGERGRRSKRHVVSNPFFDRSSIPKLARATKRWDPHGTMPQSGNPLFLRVAHASRKVLQIRKYQKSTFCNAGTRAGGKPAC